MPGQKGFVSPLIIFDTIVILIAVAVVYYFGFYNSPVSSLKDNQPEIATPPSVESPTTSGTQTPAPSVYSNPFASDDSYENPFNDI